MDFRAICTSADQAEAEYKLFATEVEAQEWAEDAIGNEWGQIVIERKDESGEWASEAVAVYKANR